MHAFNLIRKIYRKAIATATGNMERNPRHLDSQRIFQTATGLVGSLPATTQRGAIQILDPTDPDFGKFYFMVGYDPPGGGGPIGP